MTTETRRVLIIDSSPADRATTRSYLEGDQRTAYACHEAPTAAEGLALCRSLQPDAIVLDYTLPDADGLTLTGELLAEHGPLAFAIVMLTRLNDAAVSVQALKLGAHDYLIKERDGGPRLPLSVAGAIEKIQLQRQVEQQRHDLALSNQQLERALTAARMATWEWDLATDVVTWGAGLEVMLGMPAGSFGGSRTAFQALLHPDDLERIGQALAAALRGEAPYDVEFRMLRSDGTLRWTSTRGAVVRDAQGAPLRMVGVDMDITARKEAEAKLWDSEVRARAIWDTADDAMVLSDAAGIVLEANPAYCDLYGYTREQVIGQSFTIIFPPDERAEALAQYHTLLHSQVALPSYEATVRRADGITIDVDVRASFVVREGRTLALLSVIRDITERKRLADQLRRSEAQFKTLVENAPDIIARFDRELRHLYVSPAVTRATGRPQADFIGKTNRDLGMPEAQSALWDEQSRLVFQTGQPLEYEFSFASPEGVLHYQAKLVPEFDDDGSVETLMAITRDITLSKQAENRLSLLAYASKLLSSSLNYQQTLEQLARLVLPSLGDACIVDLADSQGIGEMVVAHSDPQLQELLHEIRRSYPPDSTSAHPVAQVLRSGQPLVFSQVSPELMNQHIADERHRTLVELVPPRSCMMVPLVLRGRTIGVVAVYATQAPRLYTDSDLALLEELARRTSLALDNARLYEEAQEAIREREAFLAIASHELKNPLTALLGRAQLLQRRLVNQGLDLHARDVAVIVESGLRIDQLISDLLNLAQVSSGQFTIAMAPLDIGALAQEAVQNFQGAATQHQLTLVTPEQAVIAHGHAGRLERVLYNLISNAIKYSPAGGDVHVTIEVLHGRVQVIVRDHGLGIPASAMPHLFKRFYRVARDATAQIAGSGIGLFVVKEIVSAHGGSITVESREGQGSTFTVHLPLGPAPPA